MILPNTACKASLVGTGAEAQRPDEILETAVLKIGCVQDQHPLNPACRLCRAN